MRSHVLDTGIAAIIHSSVNLVHSNLTVTKNSYLMKKKKLDRYLEGTVLVLVINGSILFILNMCAARILDHNRFSDETKDINFLLSVLSHAIVFSGWYQYIYILPLIIRQYLKQRWWVAMGIFSGSFITLLLSSIRH